MLELRVDLSIVLAVALKSSTMTAKKRSYTSLSKGLESLPRVTNDLTAMVEETSQGLFSVKINVSNIIGNVTMTGKPIPQDFESGFLIFR